MGQWINGSMESMPLVLNVCLKMCESNGVEPGPVSPGRPSFHMLGRTSAAGKIGTKQVFEGEETASIITYESPGGRKQATELSAAAGVGSLVFGDADGKEASITLCVLSYFPGGLLLLCSTVSSKSSARAARTASSTTDCAEQMYQFRL